MVTIDTVPEGHLTLRTWACNEIQVKVEQITIKRPRGRALTRPTHRN
jgi:hypothetical protein